MSATHDQPGCLACDLTAGRRRCPGGRIDETSHWVVEHCVGPLGVGTLILQAAMFDRGEHPDPAAADAIRLILQR